MSQAIAFDTYAYVKKLRDAGVDERQAAIQAEALVNLVEDRLTTKQDLAGVESSLRRDIKELDVKIESFRLELKRDIKELDVKIESFRLELKRDIKELDVKIESIRSELKRDIKELEQRMVIKLGSLMVVAVGVVAALVKLL
ncbi:MAG: CCDC90 family protein [Magnetococcus sp. THC-1_WYH]